MRPEKDLLGREYLRVSQDRSGTGRSPDQQHDDNAKAFAERGWRLHEQPYRDVDRSASRYATKAREAFERLLRDLKDGTFGADVLVLWEHSRGSRKVHEWTYLLGLLEEAGVRIYVTTHRDLYDPRNARHRRALLEDAIDSEYESAKTSQRILRHARANAEAGRPHGKNLYGYQRVYDSKTGALVSVEPNPFQAGIVQEAARRTLAGESMYKIARDFNARGVPARRPKRKHHGLVDWDSSSIARMLSNPAYAGRRVHKGEDVVEAIWPALISSDDFEKLQSLFGERARTHDSTAQHLLSGIAVCAECGFPMHVSKQNAGRAWKTAHVDSCPSSKTIGTSPCECPRVDIIGAADAEGKRLKYGVYVCAGRTRGGDGHHVAIKTDHLDEIVTRAVVARLMRPDFLAEVNQSESATVERRREILEELEKLRKYLDTVRETAARELRIDLLIDQEARLKPRMAELTAELTRLSRMDPAVVELTGVQDIRAAFDALPLEEKRRYVRALGAPSVKRSSKPRGSRGLDPARVELNWL